MKLLAAKLFRQAGGGECVMHTYSKYDIDVMAAALLAYARACEADKLAAKRVGDELAWHLGAHADRARAIAARLRDGFETVTTGD